MSETVSDTMEEDVPPAANGGGHIRYTLDELMSLGELELSRRRPDCYDDTSPAGGGVRIPWRRPAEPVRPDDDKLTRLDKRRERVRKFQEIVLSPQRRSFNMGCHMPPPPTQPPAALVPPFGRDRDGVRDRRIGSGRIVTRDVSWDYKPLDAGEADAFAYRNGGQFGRGERDGSANREEWLERRPFPARNSNSSFESNRGRGGAIRRNFRDYETEPEWFSGGPTSQFDTIELRGFEEAATAAADEPSDTTKTGGESHGKTDETAAVSPAAASPAPDTNNNAQEKDIQQREFNFDEYLHLDADFLSDHTRPADGAGSRFSQWFTRRSPDVAPQAAQDVFDSRRSSIIDELENIMNDSLSPDPSDGNSNKYFTPISPANGGDGGVSKSVMDFLHTAQIGATAPPQAPPPKQNTHKILNVKDIEASMRECGVESPPRRRFMTAGAAGVKERPEMEVFRKFVANMPNEQLVGAAKEEKLKMGGAKPFRAAAPPAGQRTAAAATYLDLVQKVIFHGAAQTNRQELLNTLEAREFLKALVRGDLSIHNLLRHLRSAMPGREQEIIVAVLWHFDKTSRAEVAAQLLQPPRPPPTMIPQPHSPSLPPPQQPLPPHSQSSQDTVSPHIVFPPAATAQPPPAPQKLSVSPLPPPNAALVDPGVGNSPITLHIPAMPQRIPSPRELQFHTQSIMQNALIRKKLEEQLENYRKRQEMVVHPDSPARRLKPQHQAAPSPTPLAFTPTSVLRKMTADKDMEPAPSMKDSIPIFAAERMVVPGMGGQAAPPPPKGRAIVKGGQQMVYASSIEMQQIQQYQAAQQRPRAAAPPMAGAAAFNSFAQQQFMQQQRHQRPPRHQFEAHYAQQMQRQQPPQRPPPPPNAPDQRTMLNFTRDGNMSPTSNQLARWFSPELLAQASAGKLPSLGVGQALSLEEFERNIQHSSTTVHN